MDIDFKSIAPRGGSQDRAFEELCCQLALVDVAEPREFRRVRGDGGDGGVECFWTDPGGNVHGLQVKYIFEFDGALRKAKESLATARKNHLALTRYVICLPFDLSGSRGRRGKSQQDKFNEFKSKEESAPRPVTVELWTAFQLRDRLLQLDSSGGRRRFWFDAACLGSDWFSEHLDTAIDRAGPRYQPQLHTGHALDDTLAALGDTTDWRRCRTNWHVRLSDLTTKWQEALATEGTPSGFIEPFPGSASSAGEHLLAALELLVASLDDCGDLASAIVTSGDVMVRAAAAEVALVQDIDDRFGPGRTNSVAWRQMQAELMCRFPARHLDECREIITALRDLTGWLEAPAVRAAGERLLLLTGTAGIGKTHGLCDAAVRRRAAGLATVIVSGAQFSSDRSIWECLAAALGHDWSRDILLDALDAAGAMMGRLLIFVDALDERTGRTRWLDDLPELVRAVCQRRHLGLCVAVRDGYRQQVLRDDIDLPTFSHPGFGMAVFDACTSFFRHFELEPPVGPLLEPEFGNPLFLLTLCQTLQKRGLKSVPTGWRGTKRVLEQLLAALDEGLRRDFPGAGNRGVSKAMSALAEALPEGGTLAWTDADHVVLQSLPASQQGHIQMLDHLVGVGLLRVVAGEDDSWANGEDRVDIAFGRLRHHLIAERLTSDTATPNDKLLALAMEDPGLAEALALVLPERGRGELVALAVEPHQRLSLLERWLVSLPWRDAETLGDDVEEFVIEGLKNAGLEHLALDALVTLALRPGHQYDHRFFHALLAQCSGGMPRRDARLCWYLHRAFERESPPSPVLRALRAPWEASLDRVDPLLREAWSVVLCWCCSAADRRVRDHATKAAVRLTEHDPSVWPRVAALFADVDDDFVLERVLCAAYGALLRNPASGALGELAVCVRDRILRRASGTPQHALIRGHAQSIGEWAARRGALPAGVRVEDFRPPHDQPIEIAVATEDEITQLDLPGYERISLSVLDEWTGDFAKYTMPEALGENEAILGAEAARRWVFRAVVELGYQPELHGYYDYRMIEAHGPGRAKPDWAERIGKKYQWIALGRLVGLLDDHARARGNVTPRLACEALRDLDPSLLQAAATDDDDDDDDGNGNDIQSAQVHWWEPVRMDFASTVSNTDHEWVLGDDFPDAAELVGALVDPTRPGQRWRLLQGHFSWDDRAGNRKRSRYRNVWMTIKGYIVPRARLEECWEALRTVDFMGTRMVAGTEIWGGVYVGEYPWAKSFPEFRETPEAWGQDEQFERFHPRPVANRLCRKEDAWQQAAVSIAVPSSELVDATATRWDGTCGFLRDDGSLVFQDPSVTGGGHAGLWIDDDTLTQLLSDLDIGLIWTVLAERQVLGDLWKQGRRLPMKHISLAMYFDGQIVQVKKAGTKKADTKKAGTKKADTKKADTKKAGTKEAGGKKAGAKKAGGKKAGTKKAGGKKAGTKKVGG